MYFFFLFIYTFVIVNINSYFNFSYFNHLKKLSFSLNRSSHIISHHSFQNQQNNAHLILD